MPEVELKNPNLGDARDEEVEGAIAALVRRSDFKTSAMHYDLPFTRYSVFYFGILIADGHPRASCPIHEDAREFKSTVFVLGGTACQTERRPESRKVDRDVSPQTANVADYERFSLAIRVGVVQV